MQNIAEIMCNTVMFWAPSANMTSKMCKLGWFFGQLFHPHHLLSERLGAMKICTIYLLSTPPSPRFALKGGNWWSKFTQNPKQRLTDVYSANWWLKRGLDPASSRVRQIPRSHFQRSVVRGSAKILWRFWFSLGRTCSRCATRTSLCSPSPIWLILSSGVVSFHLTHRWVLSLSKCFSSFMR